MQSQIDLSSKRRAQMEREKLLSYILDSYPYPVIFADCDHIIRYLNKNAEYFYYQERGYDDLIGKSIFACHNDKSKERIIAAVEKLKNHGMEPYLGVDVKNRRIYIQAVRNENGELVGYIERFEMNVQK
jgi:DUF438 domain-containing protein